jgi:hypothetical protein
MIRKTNTRVEESMKNIAAYLAGAMANDLEQPAAPKAPERNTVFSGFETENGAVLMAGIMWSGSPAAAVREAHH